VKLQGLGIYLDTRRKLKQEHKHKQRVFASSFSPVPWRQWRMMNACIGKARNQSKTNESTGNKREHNAVVQQTCLQGTPLEPYGRSIKCYQNFETGLAFFAVQAISPACTSFGRAASANTALAHKMKA
jgi:hypothetical protein